MHFVNLFSHYLLKAIDSNDVCCTEVSVAYIIVSGTADLPLALVNLVPQDQVLLLILVLPEPPK